MQEWFTVDEAARYLRVSRRTIYKLSQEGRLPAYRIGKQRHRRFQRVDLDRVASPVEGASPKAVLSTEVGPIDSVLLTVWNNRRDSAYDGL
jgi:excisionase family DNA binding protein